MFLIKTPWLHRFNYYTFADQWLPSHFLFPIIFFLIFTSPLVLRSRGHSSVLIFSSKKAIFATDQTLKKKNHHLRSDEDEEDCNTKNAVRTLSFFRDGRNVFFLCVCRRHFPFSLKMTGCEVTCYLLRSVGMLDTGDAITSGLSNNRVCTITDGGNNRIFRKTCRPEVLIANRFCSLVRMLTVHFFSKLVFSKKYYFKNHCSLYFLIMYLHV